MTIAGILLCLTLVSVWLVGGLYARYTTSDSASDTARVAKFNVTGTGFTNTIDLTVTLDPGQTTTQPYSFTITNSSEVAVAYTVVVENKTKNLPLHISVGAGTSTSLALDAYTHTANLAPGSTHNFTFSLTWPGEENDPALSGQVDNIAVTVSAVQID